MKPAALICAFVGATVCAGGPYLPSAGADDGFAIETSSFLGGAGFDDAVVGAAIGGDGTIVLAANLGADAVKRMGLSAPPGAKGNHGAILRLDAAGRKILSVAFVAARVGDLAADGEGNLYLAAGDDGVLKLSPNGGRRIWQADVGKAERVDAAADGHAAAIAGRTVHILSPAGKRLGQFKGGQFTCDVCVDAASKTVIVTGFRNARAFDGKRTYPVQICYIRGHGYDGERKWTDYDWSTDRKSDRFLNKPTNNMADSRGDRCAIGADGKLYVTFQVAGGNHLFRYSPKDITEKVKIVGGDKYHNFYNSRSEHKNVFGRYDPATGEMLAVQQFCGRLDSGRANSVVTREGDIAADAAGRVYVVGKAAYGLPLTLNPDNGDYTGGGFLLIMSTDLSKRLMVTRTCAGKGSCHAVAVRGEGGTARAVYGGSGMVEGMFVRNAVQAEPADTGGGKKDPKDAFYVVVEDN